MTRKNKDAAFYTSNSRLLTWFGAFPEDRQDLWLTKNDLQDSTSWSSPPFVLLRDVHSKSLTHYDWKEGCVPSQSQSRVGDRGGRSSQGGVSQEQEDSPLLLPQVDRLSEVFLVWGEDTSNVAVTPIPLHHRITQQIIKHCQPFQDLQQTFQSPVVFDTSRVTVQLTQTNQDHFQYLPRQGYSTKSSSRIQHCV